MYEENINGVCCYTFKSVCLFCYRLHSKNKFVFKRRKGGIISDCTNTNAFINNLRQSYLYDFIQLKKSLVVNITVVNLIIFFLCNFLNKNVLVSKNCFVIQASTNKPLTGYSPAG